MTIENFDKSVYDDRLSRGLCTGVGTPDGRMCIEAAISQACGLPFNDQPACVLPAVRAYKIRLNDSRRWKSPESRAAGLYDLGIAQLGSNTLDAATFVARLTELHIRELIPALFHELFTKDTATHKACREAAGMCERDGSVEAARKAQSAASDASCASYAASYAASDASCASYAASYASAAASYASYASASAAAAASAAADADAGAGGGGKKYLLQSASICLRVLREMECPGVALLDSLKETGT